jgi:hypothetical protein
MSAFFGLLGLQNSNDLPENALDGADIVRDVRSPAPGEVRPGIGTKQPRDQLQRFVLCSPQVYGCEREQFTAPMKTTLIDPIMQRRACIQYITWNVWG